MELGSEVAAGRTHEICRFSGFKTARGAQEQSGRLILCAIKDTSLISVS